MAWPDHPGAQQTEKALSRILIQWCDSEITVQSPMILVFNLIHFFIVSLRLSQTVL